MSTCIMLESVDPSQSEYLLFTTTKTVPYSRDRMALSFICYLVIDNKESVLQVLLVSYGTRASNVFTTFQTCLTTASKSVWMGMVSSLPCSTVSELSTPSEMGALLNRR